MRHTPFNKSFLGPNYIKNNINPSFVLRGTNIGFFMVKKPLAVLISEHKKTKINDLPMDLQVLFGFLTLVVDIEYRNRYGSRLLDKAGTARMEVKK